MCRSDGGDSPCLLAGGGSLSLLCCGDGGGDCSDSCLLCGYGSGLCLLFGDGGGPIYCVVVEVFFFILCWGWWSLYTVWFSSGPCLLCGGGPFSLFDDDP